MGTVAAYCMPVHYQLSSAPSLFREFHASTVRDKSRVALPSVTGADEDERRSIPLTAVATYIAPMRRSLVSRLAALAIAMLVGFASPALALAHGYAHHEHGEQGNAPRGALVSEATDELHDGLSRSISVAYESKDHAHPQLAHALPARMGAPLFVLSTIPAAVPVSIVFVSTAALLPTSAPTGAGPVDALPRQPRAPPLG